MGTIARSLRSIIDALSLGGRNVAKGQCENQEGGEETYIYTGVYAHAYSLNGEGEHVSYTHAIQKTDALWNGNDFESDSSYHEDTVKGSPLWSLIAPCTCNQLLEVNTFMQHLIPQIAFQHHTNRAERSRNGMSW